LEGGETKPASAQNQKKCSNLRDQRGGKRNFWEVSKKALSLGKENREGQGKKKALPWDSKGASPAFCVYEERSGSKFSRGGIKEYAPRRGNLSQRKDA